MKTITCAVLIAAACVSAALASADKPSADRMKARHEAMEKEWTAKLGLSAEQAAKLKAGLKARAEAGQATRKRAHDAMEKLRAHITLKSGDAAVQASLDELIAARKALREAEDAFASDTASYLTPTQRGKLLVGLLDHMRDRWEHGPAAHGPAARGPRPSRDPAHDKTEK